MAELNVSSPTGSVLEAVPEDIELLVTVPLVPTVDPVTAPLTVMLYWACKHVGIANNMMERYFNMFVPYAPGYVQLK